MTFLEDADDDLRLHQYECTGTNDKYERFATGDYVRFSLLGQHRLPNRDHEQVFEVISLNTDASHTVRVRDVETGRETTFAHSFLVKTGVKTLPEDSSDDRCVISG